MTTCCPLILPCWYCTVMLKEPVSEGMPSSAPAGVGVKESGRLRKEKEGADSPLTRKLQV
jgi:hypothetical protein